MSPRQAGGTSFQGFPGAGVGRFFSLVFAGTLNPAARPGRPYG
jgi:hypothetical protein